MVYAPPGRFRINHIDSSCRKSTIRSGWQPFYIRTIERSPAGRSCVLAYDATAATLTPCHLQ
ncbi:hypothetical protein HMPREF0208_02281 [Citrobacter koseri]|nr:hypothetical protein HMPREF0208_02281 [Citrobacter koseri]